MKKTIVIMSPTVEWAVYEWRAFLSKWSTVIKKANKQNRYVELLTGHKIYFKGETEGQRVLLGLHADIIRADELIILQESENKKNKMSKLKELGFSNADIEEIRSLRQENKDRDDMVIAPTEEEMNEIFDSVVKYGRKRMRDK